MVNTLISVMSILGKFAQGIDAGVNIYQVKKNKNRSTLDVVNATVQTVFVGAQAADIGLRLTPSSAQVDLNIRQGLAYTAGGLDVARVGTRNLAEYDSLSDGKEFSKAHLIAELGGTILYRTADIANVSQLGHRSQKHKEICEIIYQLEKPAGAVIAIGSAAHRLYKNPALRQWYSQRAFFKKYKESLLNETTKKAFIDSCEEIPNFLISEKAKFHHTCKITNKLIRFLYVPKLSDQVLESNNMCDVLYEKKAFEIWLQSNPDSLTPPPGWPAAAWQQNPSLKVEDFIKTEWRMQHEIDKALNEAAQNGYQLYHSLNSKQDDSNQPEAIAEESQSQSYGLLKEADDENK